MSNPEHLKTLNEGVQAWNEMLKSMPGLKADLQGADFSGKDLSGIDLRGANLEGAKLRGTKVGRGTLLWFANITNQADLYQADFSGAELDDVNFTGSDLFQANFREANLRGADLSNTDGFLRTEQFAGADLTGTRLPERLKKLYESLDNVKGISESARKIFLAVLAACLYCWLTIATTTDVNLITNRASSPLPIIQTQIPIVGFYMVAPLLVLCVYFYFHFYLQKLWEELGSLPAVFPDGRPLHTKVDPWLLNDLVRAHLPKLNVDRPFLSYFQLWISVLLAWWIVPITMLLFWGRYLRRHEQIGTWFHVVLLVIALAGAVCLYRLAVGTLRGRDRKPFTWKGILTSRRGYLTVGFAVLAGVLFGLISLGAIHGVRSNKPILGIRLPQSEDQWSKGAGGPWTWVPRWMALFGYPPFADLNGAEVSRKESSAGGKNDKASSLLSRARLLGADLRYMSAEGATLSGANMRGADITGGYLKGAFLDDADLRGVHLRDAVLSGANLNNADLSGAFLPFADLTGGNLKGAQLRYTLLNGAGLDEANLTGADLSRAGLSAASLWRANLTGTKFVGANLSSADLSLANLTGSDPREANLRGANLSMCDFRHTTNLDPKTIRSAALETWKMALYDEEMLQALGLPLDHNKDIERKLKKITLLMIQNEAPDSVHLVPMQ